MYNNNVDLNSSYHLIAQTVYKYLPDDTESIIFGSQVTGTAKKYSDIDIGIKTLKPLNIALLAQIHQELEDSDIPYLVDIIDLSTVSDKFKSVALNQTINLKSFL